MKDVSFKSDQLIKYGEIIDVNIPKQSESLMPVKTTVTKFKKIRELIEVVTNFIFGE